jgi:hypothetical protein
VLAEQYDNEQLTKGQCLCEEEGHNCSVTGMQQKKEMVNPIDTSASSPPGEEQEEKQVEETMADNGPCEGVQLDAGAAMGAAKEEIAQNIAQDEETAVTMRRVEPPAEVNLGERTAAQIRAAHRENLSVVLDRQQELEFTSREVKMLPVEPQVTDPQAGTIESANLEGNQLRKTEAAQDGCCTLT